MRYKKKGGALPRQIDVTDTIDESNIGVFDEDLDLSSIRASQGLIMSDIDMENFDETIDMNNISAIEPNIDDTNLNETDLNNISFNEEDSIAPQNETTTEEISYGGRRTRKRRNSRKMKKSMKKRKTIRKKTKYLRRGRKTRRGKKLRGGTNVGCNTNDPNFSIYNTQLLKLFPYKA